jgi:serine/threonine protein phosphatase 1
MILKTKHFKKNTKGRDFIVGDIHGYYDDLMEAMDKVNFDRSVDRMFSVGDLIDRGPDSLKCLKLLTEHWFYACIGNHETMCLQAIDPWKHEVRHNIQLSSDFYRNGGEWMMSLPDQQVKEVELLILSMHHSMYVDGVLITHANRIDDTLLDFGQLCENVWNRTLYYKSAAGKDVVPVDGITYIGKRDHRKMPVVTGHNPMYNITVIDDTMVIDCGVHYKRKHPDKFEGLKVVELSWVKAIMK